MNIAFRTDASSAIGTGHVIRCLTLANALRKKGHEIVFICQPLQGNLNTRIEEEGFPVIPCSSTEPDISELPLFKNGSKADWLIVDHYKLDRQWESTCRPWVKQILVIDDLADRPHDCDILLDQNFMPHQPTRYHGLVPKTCKCLLGTEYTLLRPEFLASRKVLDAQGEKLMAVKPVHRIMVSLGGADPNNATLKVLEALSQLARFESAPSLEVSVIVGAANPNPSLIQAFAKQHGFEYLTNIPDMAKKMMDSDLFIGAGGTTTWERFALGLPGLVISIAENHRELSRYLAECGYQVYAGEIDTLKPDVLAHIIQTLCHCPEWVSFIRQRGMTLVDAQGTARVCQQLQSATIPASMLR